MPTDLLAACPKHWVAMVRPFLQRAAEFQQRQPVVAYHVKTHVAFLCVKARTREDREGTAFLMTLLTELEQEKAALGAQLEGSDGRTVLTRTALMLFTRADDMERAGQASEAIVKIFFTASVLFEATAQYLDGELDPIAAEKRKYARFIAARMKRALDSGAPYTSHNPLEAEAGDEDAAAPQAPVGAATAAASLPAPALPPAPAPFGGFPPPVVAAPVPPPAAPAPLPPPPPPAYAQPAASSTFAPPQAFVAAPMNAPPPAGAVAGFAPSMDAMIDAQKFAKHAVSALQFYDFENARKQLHQALALLNGPQSR